MDTYFGGKCSSPTNRPDRKSAVGIKDYSKKLNERLGVPLTEMRKTQKRAHF